MKLRVSILSTEFKCVPAEYVASELTRVAAANDGALSCNISRSF